MEEAFRLVIEFKLKDNIMYFDLDTCFKKQVSLSSKIATQPLQSGETMSDHMYKEPTTFDVGGTFSLNGRKQGILYNDIGLIQSSNDRLTNIQNLFEQIKDEAIRCSLYTSNSGNSTADNMRFKKRDNMVLENISWIEYQNNVEFSFKFKEVLSVNIVEYEQILDSKPSIVPAISKSLGEVLVDTSALQLTVYRFLNNAGFIESKSIEVIKKLGYKGEFKTELTKIVVNDTIDYDLKDPRKAQAKEVNKKTIIMTLCLGGLWGAVIATQHATNAKKDKLKNKIKLVKDSSNYFKRNGKGKIKTNMEVILDNAEFQRLQDIVNLIQNRVVNIFSKIQIYTVSNTTNDISECDLALTIDSEMFVLEFRRNPSFFYNYTFKERRLMEGLPKDCPWKITVKDSSEKLLDGLNGTQYNTYGEITNFGDCQGSNNMLFTDSMQNYEVYLINPSLANTTDEKELTKYRKDLNYFQVVVSKGPVKNQMDALSKSILVELEKNGYTL